MDPPPPPPLEFVGGYGIPAASVRRHSFHGFVTESSRRRSATETPVEFDTSAASTAAGSGPGSASGRRDEREGRLLSFWFSGLLVVVRLVWLWH